MFEVPLNKFEKEKKVIQLHKQGKTIREIASEIHKNFRDISKIIKAYERKKRLETKKRENNQSIKIKKISKIGQAYNLFHNKKTPVEVAIELGLDFQKVRKYWLEYLRLNKMTKLYNIYIENEYHLDSLFKIYYYMLRNEIDFKNMENILLVADETTKLYQIHSNLKAEVEKMKQMKNNYLLNKQNTNYHQPLLPLGLPKYYYEQL
jgi:hypothetical protein